MFHSKKPGMAADNLIEIRKSKNQVMPGVRGKMNLSPGNQTAKLTP